MKLSVKVQKGIGILFLVGMGVFCLFPWVEHLPDILSGTFPLDDAVLRMAAVLPMLFVGLSFFQQGKSRRKALAVTCAIYWGCGVLALFVLSLMLTPTVQRDFIRIETRVILEEMGRIAFGIVLFLGLFVLLLLKRQRTTVLRAVSAFVLALGLYLEISERIQDGQGEDPVFFALFGFVPALAFFLSVWSNSENTEAEKDDGSGGR